MNEDAARRGGEIASMLGRNLDAYVPVIARAVERAMADAWDEGAAWAAECGAIKTEFAGFVTPGENPYRLIRSNERSADE